jgi:arsenate reductase
MLMAIQFYGYKKCGTSRKAEIDLETRGLAHEFTDITTDPPSEASLKKIIEQSDLPLKRFFNTSGIKYKELNVKDLRKNMTEAEQIKMLAGNGYLLKRPIVTDGQRATVGYKIDEFNQIWG